jgi:hypothetical protein
MTYATYRLRTPKKRLQLIQQVADFIYVKGLSDELPCIRTERISAIGNNEFFFFIGINPEFGNRLSERASEINLLLQKNQPDHYFILDEIRNMIGTQINIQRIPYIPPIHTFTDQNYSTLDEPNSIGDNDQSRTYDRLLLLLSAIGHGRWVRFTDTCAVLGITSPDGLRASHVIRRLALLGHIGTSATGDQWSVAPTVLARVGPSATDVGTTHVLCGRRDASLLDALGEVSTLATPLGQPDGGGPSVKGIVAPDEHALRQALRDRGGRLAGIHVRDASMDLATALPDIRGWRRSLPRIPYVATDLFTCKWFNGSEFIGRTFDRSTGLWELERSGDDGGGRKLKRVYYFDQATDEWLGGEFYGLRFLVQSTNERVRALHNPRTCRLQLHMGYRLPEVYERALVLASGQLPDQIRDPGVLVYRGVTWDLATKLTSKLGMELQVSHE